MFTNFKDMSSIDAMPNHVETRSRIFNPPFGRTAFRSGLMSKDCCRLNFQSGNSSVKNNPERNSRATTENTTMASQSKLNQDLITNDHVNKSTAPRTFGLQSRISSTITPFCLKDNLRLNHISDNMHCGSNMSSVSSVSRTFGLIPEHPASLSSQNNERLNQELRRNNSINSSVMQKSLGLQTRNVPSHSHLFSENNITVKQNSSMSYRKSNVNMPKMSGTSGLNYENFRDSEGFNQGLKRDSPYIFGLPPRNLALHSGLLSEGNLRLNQYSNQRNNNLSTVSKTFGPVVRNTALTNGFQMQDSTKYNDDIIDNSGFRKPLIPRIIRGRNSTLSSRLFHNQNMTKHCQDLSNVNGFNVSHISRRDLDILSESKLALNMQSNCVDNQSVGESVLSVTSMKSQFLNLLENLHHSILNIGPNVTAEAVRMEFDRAKQRLENISEMSFAPSVNEVGAGSVVNQSSKYICPAVVSGSSLHLKSSKDLLKMLMPREKNSKNKFNLSTHAEEGEREKACVEASSLNKEYNDEQDSDSLFKKPRPYNKKKKSSRMMKIKTPQVAKSLTSKTTNKIINLKQWYPIAIGHDLAFCGVDDKGLTVKTDVIKKRLNCRKVELINGLNCNLIGSPSSMVSLLPKKILTFLKNGLTDRWRVLQKELLNCQTAEEKTKKRNSKSPKVKNSPRKKTKKTPEKKIKKEKLKSPKFISTPKTMDRGMHTRSGRTVKPPSMFWLLTRSNEVTSSLERPISETSPVEVLSKRKTKKSNEETPVKKSKKTTFRNKKPKKTIEETPVKKAKMLNDSSSGRYKKKSEKSPGRNGKSPGDASFRTKKAGDESCKISNEKQSKVRSSKNSKKKENEEEVKVHSSTEDGKQQIKSHQAQGRRKRKVAADTESVQAKKSKLEKKTEVEVESTVDINEPVTRKGRKKTNKLELGIQSPKPKGIKSPSTKKKRDIVKKKTISKDMSENKKEMKEVIEFEEDFELNLNDIEIPEIANVSGNPQLSRSQLKLVSMETPPLKYFNSNLKLLGSATPVRSPDWCISQRTESEVKQFQRRREEAFKKKITVDKKKTMIVEKTKNVQSKDVKRVMEWVTEKTMRSPQWKSKLLQYVIPSRKRMEEQDDEEEEEEEEEDEDLEIGFL